ncbi:spermidine synthase [Bordetella trematum]|uniref:spermine/spermidine synthase domain-containing protein n=1 Tax=Bordetella trematum TaxID=123899 RepID=UPI0013FD7C06|nr:spermidine synthase [Bordetella trematum]QIM71282.1 spermidine synthase [Bordetella trematum]
MLNILESDGVRTLHFGSLAVQGAMRIDKPVEIELEYVEQMMMWLLFRKETAHIVQLGLGAAALTKFCYHRLAPAEVTAVEIDADVIDACRNHFALPPDDERLSILNMDALDYVTGSSRYQSIDILQVDLYDAPARGPLLSTDDFYAACANCLTADGMMTVNLYCDWPEHMHHVRLMEQSFEAVAWLPEVHDGNMVAIAFKQSPSVDFDDLFARAAEIQAMLGLPAQSWVDGLHRWMSSTTDEF